MNNRKKSPGVSRSDRISEQGLARLEKQLSSGISISPMVLDQWILRYGESARRIIDKYQKENISGDKKI